MTTTDADLQLVPLLTKGFEEVPSADLPATLDEVASKALACRLAHVRLPESRRHHRER
ncbi:MAG TPA: hypothetical protein VEC15_08725 [Actinomycetota bacterium]|nr:hypothetical protein [Actinomycetota bacterium]